MRRAERWRRWQQGRPGLTVGVLVALAMVGCSSAPPPDEVIPNGTVPQGEHWCAVVSDEQVRRLLGEGELERVLQVGDLEPHEFGSPRCDVVWADGADPVELVTVSMYSVAGIPNYSYPLSNLRAVVGENGERLANGEVVELRPGVYADVALHHATVFLACEEGKPLPALAETTLSPRPTESGEQWTDEELAATAARLAEVVTSLHRCSGEILGLGPEDGRALTEKYLRLEEELLG